MKIRPTTSDATLWLWPRAVLFRGVLMELSSHAYAAAVVLLGEQAGIEVAGQGTANAWLVAAGSNHAANFFGGRCSVVLLDVDTSIARSMISHIPANGLLAVPADKARDLLRSLAGVSNRHGLAALGDALKNTIEGEVVTLDPRVAGVCARLRQSAQAWPGVRRLAAEVGLSEPRLQHLFKAQTGIRLGQFKTALQMRNAALAMARGSTLTAAAYAAGFADSAHFSRHFRKMFGAMPSVIFRQLGPSAIQMDLQAGAVWELPISPKNTG